MLVIHMFFFLKTEMLDFLLAIQSLKTTKRTGWINNQIENPESIADHMHRMAIISMLTDCNDRDKLVKMAIIHDIAEAKVGDITPYDGISNEAKFNLEKNAIEEFVQMLGGSSQALEIRDLWMEYEKGESEISILCKDIDKFEMILQAFEYEKDGKKLDSFFESTKGKFRTPQIINLAEELYSKRTQ